jgi:hypothetical protein
VARRVGACFARLGEIAGYIADVGFNCATAMRKTSGAWLMPEH